MKKKVIKLTEKDIESLVEKILKEEGISELDKKTYFSAAEKAKEKGMGKLSDKFRKHGAEKGISVVDSIRFSFKRGEEELMLSNIDLKLERSHHGDTGILTGTKEDGDTTTINVNIRKVDFSKEPDAPVQKVSLYHLRNHEVLPISVMDAKNLIKVLADGGLNMGEIRPKQISSDYVDMKKYYENRKKNGRRLSENLPRRERERHETNFRRDNFEPYEREDQLMDIFGPYKQDVPPNVISYMRKNPALIIKRLEQVYGRDKILRYLGGTE